MHGNDGVGELVADGDRILGAGNDLGRVVRPVGVGGALALGVGARLEIRGGGIVGDIGAGELDLCLLGDSLVGGGDVGRESVVEILLVALADSRGARAQRVQYGVRDSQGDLRFRGQRLGKVDNEVLVTTVESKVSDSSRAPITWKS